MSSKLLPFTQPTSARSLLFKNPPETVPPTDELESLQAELKVLRQKSWERAKKAGEDLKTIEESMKRIKEREKGKAKAVEKVKRERGCTYFCPIVLVRVFAHESYISSRSYCSFNGCKIPNILLHAPRFLLDLLPYRLV